MDKKLLCVPGFRAEISKTTKLTNDLFLEWEHIENITCTGRNEVGYAEDTQPIVGTQLYTE